MTTQAPTKTVSPEEYLAQEEKATERHEYIQGVVKAMVGGSFTHHKISLNLTISLSMALKKYPYEVCHADMKLWIPLQQVITYPDVMIASKPLVMLEGRKDTVMNACLVAEVLSPSTRNYDHGEKFDYYRSIPEFQEYLLIEQEYVCVKHYVKIGAKKWSLTEYTELDDVIKLESVGCEIALADIYEDIEL
ncbi:Uma2 family endonuclease [[Limnothrix rosea] IAM M-220]|uniref:Uma2 family endonuclease n=1 Tax=[Limnothrix rosea] IAM M-220 TaxID=454133 RepID=UPI0009FDB3CB|nr:Uma2 family endonuclease [[Limnothrix rosea] IAM M-220]